jgi:hypothetical protein
MKAHQQEALRLLATHGIAAVPSTPNDGIYISVDGQRALIDLFASTFRSRREDVSRAQLAEFVNAMRRSPNLLASITAAGGEWAICVGKDEIARSSKLPSAELIASALNHGCPPLVILSRDGVSALTGALATDAAEPKRVTIPSKWVEAIELGGKRFATYRLVERALLGARDALEHDNHHEYGEGPESECTLCQVEAAAEIFPKSNKKPEDE